MVYKMTIIVIDVGSIFKYRKKTIKNLGTATKMYYVIAQRLSVEPVQYSGFFEASMGKQMTCFFYIHHAS